jgi:DNA-directed RNA polymerase specialized sigma24 family protein
VDNATLADLTQALRARGRRLGSRDPDDLAQEALRRTLESDALSAADDLARRKYAFRTLHNLFIDEKRRERRSLRADLEPIASNPELTVADREQLQQRTNAAAAHRLPRKCSHRRSA